MLSRRSLFQAIGSAFALVTGGVLSRSRSDGGPSSGMTGGSVETLNDCWDPLPINPKELMSDIRDLAIMQPVPPQHIGKPLRLFCRGIEVKDCDFSSVTSQGISIGTSSPEAPSSDIESFTERVLQTLV